MVAARHARIVVADSPSPWRTALVTRLDQPDVTLRITDSGEELRSALEEVVEPPKLIIIGEPLQILGGLEALYLADQTLALEKKVRPAHPARTVSLITDVRSDAEYLDVVRRRGVTQFIHRRDSIDRTVAALVGSMNPKLRTMVRMDASIQSGTNIVHGAVYDLSLTGAQLIVPAAELAGGTPLVGTTLDLTLVFRNVSLKCPAEIRRLAFREGSSGKRLVLGVHLKELDDAATLVLERMIVDASEEYEVTQGL